MPCTCSEFTTCDDCWTAYHASLAASYAEAADAEAKLRQKEHDAECVPCVRCGGPAFHGICDSVDCQRRGVAAGVLSPGESAAIRCSICSALVESVPAAVEADWCRGYWEGDVWRDPCCGECFDREIDYDDGIDEYVRVVMNPAKGVAS